jgi:hypothetical protein
MSDLEVRSPVPPAKSTADVVDQVLAGAREDREPAARRDAQKADAQKTDAQKTDALAAKTGPAANPNAFSEMAVRTPPGPHAKPAPAPLKGPAAATPPKGPSAEAAAAAAKAAAAKAAASKLAAAKAAAAKPAPPPEPAAPPAAAAKPAGPPSASQLIDDTAPWLPDEEDRKVAFLQVFRYWHAQVRPEYAHKARPAFLFLVTALPVMVKARDTLQALNLWEPPGEHSRQARDVHPAWKKYCEFLPRATQALQELDDYRHLSLLLALDDLNGRVIKAEKKFREGVQVRGR